MSDGPPERPMRFPHPELPESAYRRTTAVLRLGLVASLTALIGALGAYLLLHPGASSSNAIASNPIAGYLSLAGLAHGLAAGAPEAYLTLGIFILIATPIARVLVGIYFFRRGHETEMTAVTIAVLVLLLVGIFVVGPWVR
ncbi:MAG: DUF1634 domain-containing protein [Thermoplasmata archaeon]